MSDHKKIRLPQSDEKLQAECRFSAFRATGKGGQHVNATDSAVRLVHLPTGLIVTSQKERSQHLNKRECLKKLRERIEKLNYRPPKRIPSKMPKAAKQQTLAKKAQHSEKKRLRRKLIEE